MLIKPPWDILLPMLLVGIIFGLFVLLYLLKTSPPDVLWQKAILKFLELRDACIANWKLLAGVFAGVGIPPLLVALLWGFSAALYLSVTMFIGSFSIIFFGGFGGEWIGPNAAQANRSGKNFAILIILPAFFWTLFYLLASACFPFPGFSPWPQR